MGVPDIEILEAGSYGIWLGNDALALFLENLKTHHTGQIAVLTDENTAALCLPELAAHLPAYMHINLPAGEENKNLQHCALIWERLSSAHFERGDILLNLGGGMVTDIGGFAASAYKRGIRFVNIPTSLLAMADAAVGGKTGINILGYKNQVGSFADPFAVVLHVGFLKTLTLRELRAGYAEVLKHYLIADAGKWMEAAQNPVLPTDWGPVVRVAMGIKTHFTMADPKETGIRKALNFGHTIGHAVESYFLKTRPRDPLLHGEAVAIGMICEAWVSWKHSLLSEEAFFSVSALLLKVFGKVEWEASEIGAIAQWCLQDKKNTGGKVNCTLLRGIGDFAVDQHLGLEDIEAALQAYGGMHG